MVASSGHPLRLLILGGTTEASALAEALADDASVRAILSLAGRTARPIVAPIPMRVGGFGGAEGLAAYLRAENVDALIDATHPFATTIKRSAAAAAVEARTPLLAIRRPEWRAVEGDRWIVVSDLAEAARAIGDAPRRVFLTVGRKDLAPFAAAAQHHYVVRSVDAPPAEALPPRAQVIAARGPFGEDAERALMTEHAIEVVVTKNSGGEATRAKLTIARERGIPVIMVRRPPPPDVPAVATVGEALAWVRAHSPRSFEPRGV